MYLDKCTSDVQMEVSWQLFTSISGMIFSPTMSKRLWRHSIFMRVWCLRETSSITIAHKSSPANLNQQTMKSQMVWVANYYITRIDNFIKLDSDLLKQCLQERQADPQWKMFPTPQHEQVL